MQGDPLMLALFSLDQHPALLAVQAQLQDGERLFAFLDDVYVVCSPARVNAIYGLLQNALFAHSSIRVHNGKTQVWNRGGVVPAGIEVLQAVVGVNDPDAIVWRGDPALHSEAQGVRILGTPLGHSEFVRSLLAGLSETHDQLMEKVLSVQDLQCAWLLLLYCCSARANCTLRVVHPKFTARFAAHRDASLRRYLGRLLGVAPANIFWDLACLPLSLGGLGLRSATLLSRPAYWSSWADCLQMVQQRRDTHRMCAHRGRLACSAPFFPLGRGPRFWEHLAAAGFHAPSWQELAAGARPEQLQWDEEMEPGLPVATQSHRTCPWPSRGGHHQTQTLSDRETRTLTTPDRSHDHIH